ncbi:beta-ketoacyl synthase N-terminal-like domain-containing protein [Nonomuraea gerenzanensis]|nr:beta-ketoacyl synthase N-terminal-like domain-containing protein [Nonomuraea gerenzanensis]UBU17186.1 phosphopantetheine-binding protein [Nonomuraea gerenzanensis]
MSDVPAVAIVGMSGRFPGARDLGEFWRNLLDGACSIADFTEEELLSAGVDAAELRSPGYVASKGFLADADRFEHELFGFNATEAAALDPQHRQLLETAWSALEDAGHDPRRTRLRTGVYVGGGPSEHAVAAQVDGRLRARLGAMRARVFTDREFMAGWLSYRLGLTGPSLTVQTGCSTSLATVHVAVQALLNGECDLALAGGVSIDSPYPRGYLYEPGGISSPDGRCRPFDEKAAGTVGGDGVGLVVLRLLEDAVADGDPVYAVIRGTAAGNDGAGRVGFTAPGVDGQTSTIVEAWAAAGLDPADAQFLEAHGTGTDLGDRIEVAAAAAAFRGARRCALGSVKSNVGHLNAAAGVAGLIKAALMLRHRTMVPTVNVTRPHPDLALDDTPFRLLTRVEEWERPAYGPRLAGVSSLGIGGTNVHVVLEEPPSGPAAADTAEGAEGAGVVLPLSAWTGAQLATAARRLAAALREPDAPRLADVAHTLAHGRAALEARAYVTATTREQAATALESLATGLDASRDDHRSTSTAQAASRTTAIGAAWAAGHEVTWPETGGHRTHLPTYPFAGHHHGALTLTPPPTSHQPPARQPDTETAVTALFRTTLALTGEQDLDRTYFAAGGDSLTAVFLVSELRDRFALDVPIDLFLTEHPLRELISRAVHGEEEDLLADLLDELEP